MLEARIWQKREIKNIPRKHPGDLMTLHVQMLRREKNIFNHEIKVSLEVGG